MKINLHVQGFESTPAIVAHVHRQLDFNLANFADHIQTVDVYIKDINGPKGGEDMKAIICVRLFGRQTVKVESTREDLYAALAIAARHAKRTVKRSIGKHRHMQKIAAREFRQFPQL